jgi:transcriptional regulator with XRE-family HTH domain
MSRPARRVIKSLRSPEQRALRALLKAARKHARLTQEDLAERLRSHQSFVAKYEIGERRLDVVEFIRVARAMGVEPARLFRTFVKKLPQGTNRGRTDNRVIRKGPTKP